MPSAPTKAGTRKLSDVARHVVAPVGIVSTGYPAVRDKCRDMGIVHDDWQQGLGRLALGKRRDGKYAATVGGVVLSIPRQVGKTFTIGSIIFALCLLFPNLTVIWTAHRARTSNETFRVMQGLARRTKVRPHVLAVRQSNGEQEITFRNGSRIMFGAREQGFGRGFAEVDVEVFDEAQILSERALEDMVAATNQARHPAGALLFYMGTPPRPVDPGEAFANKRAKALAGSSKDMVYVELSADEDADPDDRKQWAIANPSYPVRTPPESMERLRENVGSDESFLREGLGRWDPDRSGSVLPAWSDALDKEARIDGPVSFGLAVAEDRSWSCIAAAGPTCLCAPPAAACTLKTHTEVTGRDGGSDYRPGTGWVVGRLVELTGRHGPTHVVIRPGSAAGSLIPELETAGVAVVKASGQEYAHACGLLYDAVALGEITHLGQGELDFAVRGAVKRTSGDAYVWDQRKSSIDISPLEAATLAVYGHKVHGPVDVTGAIW